MSAHLYRHRHRREQDRFADRGGLTSLPLSDDATLDPGDTVVGIGFSGNSASIRLADQAALRLLLRGLEPGGSTIQILDAPAPARVPSTA